MARKGYRLPIFLSILAFFVWFSDWKLLLPPYLTFSDSAKFADIARNFITGQGFGASFAPFQTQFLDVSGLLPMGIPPLYPFLIALGFKMFGIQDLVVILTSGFFYLLSALALYFLGKKVFGELVGILASLAFIFDPAMLTYATSGASESLFVFELILAALLFCLNTRKTLFFGFLTLVTLYFTRPSAIIYIVGFVLFFIFLRFKEKGQIFKAVGLVVIVWLLAEAILTKLSGRFFLYSPISSFLYSTAKFSPLAASTETLRGGMAAAAFQLKPFVTKLFYDLYNLYKLLPQILSPYLAGFYVFSLLRWEKERKKRVFRGLVLFFVLATFFAAAASLPIYRYLHPVIPFVYLLAVEMIVWMVSKIVQERKLSIINHKQSLLLRNKASIMAISFFLVFIFVIGQTAGKIFLDSRYLQAHTNQGKPPVYVKLAWILRENTKPDELAVTNLDTWGSWYGERKTIWFPLKPNQLIPKEGKQLKVDTIYLTSYKMDDENYYMGQNWRQAFEHPEAIQDEFLAENFLFGGRFEIKPEETYEREGATAVFLIRK